MFSFADQHTTAGILAAAGFTDIAFTDVREPVCYGADSGQAYDFVTGLQSTQAMLASLDPAAAEDALRGLRVTLAGHTTRDGVLFGARTWIITARTPRRTICLSVLTARFVLAHLAAVATGKDRE